MGDQANTVLRDILHCLPRAYKGLIVETGHLMPVTYSVKRRHCPPVLRQRLLGVGYFCHQDDALVNSFDKGVGYGQREKLRLRIVI